MISVGKVIWIEDDAGLRDPDHETIEKAWLRLFGEILDRKQATEVDEERIETFYRMPNGKIVCDSYPGDSAIYEPET